MDALDTAASFMDSLLDFSSDIDDDEGDYLHGVLSACQKTKNPLKTSPSPFALLPSPKTLSDSFVEEEELEWISNKNAFPMVESLVDIIPNHPSIATTTTTAALSHHSPVSVLETSSGSSSSSGRTAVSLSSGSFKVPGKARSKQQRKRRRDMVGEQWHSWAPHHEKKSSSLATGKTAGRGGGGGRVSSTLGRKCLHCQAEKTPQWRAGPYGPKTLCNACGVRYKSGRLVPEYRPASSPTFSSELHSNSHRKIMEMRKYKTGMGPSLGSGLVLASGLVQEGKRPTKEEIG